MAEVVDLLSSDSEPPPADGNNSDGNYSDADLPPLAALTSRLQSRLAASGARPPAQPLLPPPPAAAAVRPPLSVLHNSSPRDGTGKAMAGVSPLEPQYDLPRPQYHQQEQQQRQAAAAAPPPASTERRGPARGKRVPTWGSPKLGAGSYEDEDADWQPPASNGGSQALSQSPAAGCGAKPGRGAKSGAAPKPRQPKRTREEAEQERELKARQRAEAKALKQAEQARQRADAKQRKQADTKKWAMQQVRLLVDTALMSSGGGAGGAGGSRGSGSLGVGMLAALDDHNSSAPADKQVAYAVSTLDLAPYKCLRWQRRRLVDGGAGEGGGPSSMPGSQALGTQASLAVAGSQLAEQWSEEPHVMVCFQPQEFVDEVKRDRLAGLFALLERRAPGQQPHLLVCGLSHHLSLTETRQHQAAMRGQQCQMKMVEEFVAELAVACPRLAFREVVDGAQAAQHVRNITSAIATLPHRESEVTMFLKAHDKTDSQVWTNLLINQPLEDRQLEAFARSIAAIPTVKPAIAHTLATNYGSLGGLMDVLLDPTRSDKQKTDEIANLSRARGNPGARAMRVGPAAAKQLLDLLRCADPDVRVREGGDAAGAEGEAG
ncbi:crossover junction endonuclease EME1-like isoform B [Micractinium conductrix]|uniref:Crossover junction endonuclease EME1-like isoform B n=1 Tax=Micractinium conductrix TaxID=554055 RepID=A0A2P6VGE5_9CHLO|nr:crossover junction endonuclease EME1-like isoform B [Micractinium conductrix]|eukprot:PSC73147.1 crossover junction endonuclease EME1-like isoform B [Micractinium conductrix]